MRSTKTTQFIVGAFVLVGLAVIFVSIFLIGANTSMFSSKIHLGARFPHVQGLAPGSLVSLSGLRIGNIERIDFLGDTNEVHVIMEVEKNEVRHLAADSQVEIRTQGALGDKFIFIIPGTVDAPRVKDGDELTVAKSTDIFAILAERGKEAEKVFDILADVRKTTQAISGQDQMAKIMNNFLIASESLKVGSRNIEIMSQRWANVDPKKVQDTIAHMDSILAKLDRGQGTLGALINDPSLHEKLKSIFGENGRQEHLKSILRTSVQKSESK